jgi:hypothetical protein
MTFACQGASAKPPLHQALPNAAGAKRTSIRKGCKALAGGHHELFWQQTSEL